MSTLPEFVARLRTESPAALGKLDDKVVSKLIRAAFANVAREIESAPDGVIRVVGLGAFRVRTVESDANGKGGGRRVLFRPKPPKPTAAG